MAIPKERIIPTTPPKYNIGDHISNRDSYWGRFTGIVTEYIGLINNVDGPNTCNHCYRYKCDLTGTIRTASEKTMAKCRKPVTK